MLEELLNSSRIPDDRMDWKSSVFGSQKYSKQILVAESFSEETFGLPIPLIENGETPERPIQQLLATPWPLSAA